MSHRVCPWWVGYLLASLVRRLLHDPAGILAPHVCEGMTVLEDRKLPRPRPRLAPGTWRCVECGADRNAANRRRGRLGLRPVHGNAIVCSPRCAEARELRRYVVRYGRPPRRRKRS